MKSNKVNLAVIGTGNRYFFAYAEWIKTNSDKVELVAIAETVDSTRKRVGDYHNLNEEARFSDYKKMFEYIKDKNVDGVIIATSDRDHYYPSIDALRAGYNLLLEKPIAPDAKTCQEIVKVATECKKVVMVAHVLRYTPFFDKIKNIIKSGVIGDIQIISHTENILSFHMAHSFVRGNWGNSKKSSPIILAKSCHDLDILQYLVGEERNCVKVAGFGSLGHFRKECAPSGATERCGDKCPVYKTCPYSVDIYFNLIKVREGKNSFASVVAPENTPEALTEALKTSPYGRCVYHCDNDVCDHMSSIIEYDNGLTIAFTLTAFTDDLSRTIKIMGSHGQIRATTLTDTIEVSVFGQGAKDFKNGNITTYNPLKEAEQSSSVKSGHDGGDSRFINDFVETISGSEGRVLTSAEVSLKSHLIAFALEESRVSGSVVNMKEFVKKL